LAGEKQSKRQATSRTGQEKSERQRLEHEAKELLKASLDFEKDPVALVAQVRKGL
jgi:hypothetical protein